MITLVYHIDTPDKIYKIQAFFLSLKIETLISQLFKQKYLIQFNLSSFLPLETTEKLGYL
jgi:hypothetical protein